ncbi:activating transcription factor 7-interacting protein 1-like isoform X2 [Daphnia carinata]|uniref:activating transcription factor 7-interacting protein 1-like isoform X2 n=1 Tax=Daphnia carinata TaxID=120202 RepID=UPI0028684423|nr:activating transcription factor 7-interacting protein 1-like isoform X2 [Daphnia carinata]
MVDDGRKVDQADQVITETTPIVNPSLKLKINLRDRQTIYGKRHRSSSPANSSDSSSTYGSTRSSSRHHAVRAGGVQASSIKRNRRELNQRRRADEVDEPSPQTETPPSSSNGSPAKRNATETDSRHMEMRKVRIGSGGGFSEVSVTTKERRTKSLESPDGGIPTSNILLVDMNGDETPSSINENQIVDPSGSPPASPVEKEVKCEVEMKSPKLETKLETKLGAATSKLVKRLTREELERLVMEQMCLSIRERGITGELERKLEAADAQLDRYRRRSEALHKQVSDLELVVRRFVQQSKNRNQTITPPMKMTRSVGLQINLASHPSIAQQMAALKKPAEAKPAVSIVPAVTIRPASNPTQSVATSVAPSMTSPNSSANNLARVPIPPSFTMQSPDIASYVPQQAVPRYRTAPQRRVEEAPNSPKIATYVNIGGIKSIPGGASVASKLLKNSVNITPVVPLSVKQQPNQSQPNPGTVAAMLARARSATTGDLNNTSAQQSIPACVPMARWSKVPASRATTVNKVTLPGRLPNVIDLTDEDLEKERAAAAAGRLIVPRPMPKASPTNGTAPNATSNGLPRGVALKSTTLNGRSPLSASKAPISPSPNINTKPALTHPAPLPPAPVGPVNPSWKSVAPRPTLDIKRVANGIVLSWNMQGNLSHHADIASYQLFAYQEGSDPPTVNGSVWKRVGEVKALPLPMACTLTQFLEGHRYHFAVRAMDVHGRAGPYSEPGTIILS